MSMPSWTSPRASDRTLPISRVIARDEALLVLGHEVGEREHDLAALRRRRAAPHRPGGLGGLDGHRDVGGRALLEAPDDVAPVGRVAALERLAARGLDPLPGDEVPERRDVGRGRRGGRRGGLGHGCECRSAGAFVGRFAGSVRRARRPSRPSRRRPGTGSRGRSGPRGGRARGAASRRCGRRSRRSGGRARWRRR